jgi:UDP-glucose 4-epimerase
VDTVLAALQGAERGETYIPRVPSARVIDVAEALIEDRPIEIVTTGIRPGEKLYESLISEEEATRSSERGEYYVINSILPEIRSEQKAAFLTKEYSSADNLMSKEEVVELLRSHRLLLSNLAPTQDGELLA